MDITNTIIIISILIQNVVEKRMNAASVCIREAKEQPKGKKLT